MIFLIVWIIILVWGISVASKRKLSGGAMAGVIIMSFIIPIVGVILAYTLPAPASNEGRANNMNQGAIAGSNMEELERAQNLLEKGAISKDEYQEIKARLLE